MSDNRDDLIVTPEVQDSFAVSPPRKQVVANGTPDPVVPDGSVRRLSGKFTELSNKVTDEKKRETILRTRSSVKSPALEDGSAVIDAQIEPSKNDAKLETYRVLEEVRQSDVADSGGFDEVGSDLLRKVEQLEKTTVELGAQFEQSRLAGHGANEELAVTIEDVQKQLLQTKVLLAAQSQDIYLQGETLESLEAEIATLAAQVKISEKNALEQSSKQGEKEADAQLLLLKTDLDTQIKAYINLQVNRDTLGSDVEGGKSIKMTIAQDKLKETVRQSYDQFIEAKQGAESRSWFTFAADPNKFKQKFKAHAAVTRLSENLALKVTETSLDQDLDVNLEILSTLTNAYFVMMHPPKAAAAVVGEEVERRESLSGPTSRNTTPLRPVKRGQGTPGSTSVVEDLDSTPLRQSSTRIVADITEETVRNKAQTNIEVAKYIRRELIKLRARTDGLLGSESISQQVWGAIMLTIALTIAAIAIMSVAGVVAPAFMLAYLTAIQTSTVVTSVLGVVAAALSVETATAATVIAATAATSFGLFGAYTYNAGRPSRFKQDVVAAVDAIEAVLPPAPAM